MKPIVHTLDLFYPNTYSYTYVDISQIIRNLYENEKIFKSYSLISGNGHVYMINTMVGNIKMIHWNVKCKNFYYSGLEIRLNLKLFVNKNNYTDVTYCEELPEIKTNFDILNKNYFNGELPPLDFWKVKRIDYAVDINVDKLIDFYSEVIEQGDAPKGFLLEDRGTKGQFYARKQSEVISFYNKFEQMIRKYPEYNSIQDTYGKLRFEIQCKKSKITNMIKDSRSQKKSNYFIDMVTPDICKDIVTSYIAKVLRRGDFYSMKEAKNIICRCKFDIRKEKNLLVILNLVSRYKSIYTARIIYDKEEYGDSRKFNKYLDILDSINVNPITIPKKYNKKRIESLYSKIVKEFE